MSLIRPVRRSIRWSLTRWALHPTGMGRGRKRMIWVRPFQRGLIRSMSRPPWEPCLVPSAYTIRAVLAAGVTVVGGSAVAGDGDAVRVARLPPLPTAAAGQA